MSSKKIEPYGTIQELAPNLYVLDGEWKKTRFRRRMTIMRLKSGKLVIHNAIQLHDQDYSSLEKLGTVSYIIAPNSFHSSEAHFYKLRYPQAALFVSSGSVNTVSKYCTVDGVLPGSWPEELKKEIECFEFLGTRIMVENIFFHKDSKTLVVTDLVFNMQCDVSGAEKMFFKLNKIYKRFGPSNIFKYVFINSKNQALSSLQQMFRLDFDRVIMNHGDVVSSGAKAKLIKAFAEIGFTHL